MADRLMVDLGVDGEVSVTPWLDGELPAGPAGEPFELAWPLDPDALESLRWYLEDYLRIPYGVYGERGPEIAEALTGWGEAVFDAIFGSGPGRDAYQRIRSRESIATEVVFRSSSPALLGLPWELLRDPSRPTPLTLDLVGVTRSLPTSELGQAFEASGEKLRVLMVISRPGGTEDVGYRMIARPLLERLEAVRGRVDLVVLRPPTLEELGTVLAQGIAEGRPFQVVHFDGHGALVGDGRTGPRLTFDAAGAEGVLAFEKPGGGSDEVPAAKLAQVLKQGQVPLVVLNACQSGAVGKELEAAVATRLLQEGVGSVVAMAYIVYAVAAAEFMTAFYERLFAGDNVTQAVGAGRRRLYERDRRPSSKGEMPLADWLVPVHYLRREIHFPYLRQERAPDEPSLDDMLDDLRERADEDHGELDPVETFVGRDGLFYDLERAARLRRVVLLYGPGGTGKTELAKAFGRWWRDTGGVEEPEWVIFHSFEPGVASFGLEGVVAKIGLRVFGPEFARLDTTERRAVVEEVLQTRRLLLIWDNFESVFTMPAATGATPSLSEVERQELRAFLQRIAAAGRSSAIITSRTKEEWLGDVFSLAVGGLAAHEVDEYADQTLAPYPAATPRRGKRAFAELLQWLDGHPLSLRLVLPHLATTEPEALLEGLQGAGELPLADDGGRTTSLKASVAYSFEHLDDTSRRLLVAVCLFQGVADVDVLGMLSRAPDVPERFAGVAPETWTGVLDRAADVGLLTAMGAGMYRIHPALPGVLAALWRNEEPDGHDDERTATSLALMHAHAALGTWLHAEINHGGDAGAAYAIVSRQRRTLGHMLRLALDNEMWDAAQAIVQPLDDFFDVQGEYDEARAWVDRVRLALEAPDGTPPRLSDPAGSLWLFLVGSQANRELLSHHLDAAERTYRDIFDMLEAQPASEQQQRRLGISYHHLGIVAQHRGQRDEAERWYRKSLALKEELGDQPGMASSYHQLGILDQHRGRLDAAEQWYRKSLRLEEETGNRSGVGDTYHQLGMVAHLRRDYDESERWCRKSLEIEEELGNRMGISNSYHHLGTIAQHRGQLAEAERLYGISLEIREELGDMVGMAAVYHQLGILAHEREQLDAAEQWYRKSLQLEEEVGNQAGIASSYGQLGVLAIDRGDLDEALQWSTKGLEIREALGDPPRLSNSYQQLGIIAQARGDLDEAHRWFAKALDVNVELGDPVGISSSYGQLGLLALAREEFAEAMDLTVRCVSLVSALPSLKASFGPRQLAFLTTRLGMEALEDSWLRIVGTPLPEGIRALVAELMADDPGDSP